MENGKAVVGLGNTLRRDDGIGILILESLSKSYRVKGLDYLDYGIASFDLVHRMRGYEEVLLIDGIDAGRPFAELSIFQLEDAAYTIGGASLSTHGFNVSMLFELYKRLRIKTRIYIAGIQVKDISYGEGLTDELRQRQGYLTKEVSRFIDTTLFRKKQ
jgi:hydrogenase maturation protease